MEIVLQILVAVALGICVAALFVEVEETKQQRRERRRVERWVPDRIRNRS